jgi:hypothetical protein
MKTVTVSTAVLAVVWTASAHAQWIESTPGQQAPSPYGQPAPAPAPYSANPPPPAQDYPAAATTTPTPYVYEPTPASAQGDASDRTATGFHVALGLGFAGGMARPGIATQFKIGVRLSPSLKLYYYALNDWYLSAPTAYRDKYVRIAAVNGFGADYFVVPKLGGRFGLGLAGDLPEDWSNSVAKPRYLGYSFFMGLTWEILDSRSHLSIDPVINVLQLSENSVWRSTTSYLLTLNWVYN